MYGTAGGLVDPLRGTLSEPGSILTRVFVFRPGQVCRAFWIDVQLR